MSQYDDISLSEMIAAFSKQLGINLCIYDYSRKLNLPNYQVTHNHPFCESVKIDLKRFHKCLECDTRLIKQHLASTGTTFIKVCHQDVLEIVYPITHQQKLIGVICAGTFQYNELWNSENIFKQKKNKNTSNDYHLLKKKLPQIDQDKADDILLLIQLLELKIQETLDKNSNEEHGAKGYKGIMQRYFQINFTNRIQLQDLAKELHLSESRVTQLLKIYFKKSFPEILKEHRIEYSKSLLENTLYPVIKVSKVVGFSDQGYFHRIFKKNTGMTPTNYRNQFKDQSSENV